MDNKEKRQSKKKNGADIEKLPWYSKLGLSWLKFLAALKGITAVVTADIIVFISVFMIIPLGIIGDHIKIGYVVGIIVALAATLLVSAYRYTPRWMWLICCPVYYGLFILIQNVDIMLSDLDWVRFIVGKGWWLPVLVSVGFALIQAIIAIAVHKVQMACGREINRVLVEEREKAKKLKAEEKKKRAEEKKKKTQK